MTFFTNFPVINYNFGDEILPSTMQNISVYVDLLDQVADDASFYESYTIQDGERPDTLSYKLYGTTEFYWMFYLLNEKLRRQGWPLTFQEIQSNIKIYYPHKVIRTYDTFFDRMYLGDTVIQGAISNPTAIGKVVKKDFDNGQLFIQPVQEVRTITVTEGGSGYTTTPTIEILDKDGEQLPTDIVNARASANVSNGSVTAINVTFGGIGFVNTPTVKISEPQIVDWESVAQTIENITATYTDTFKVVVSRFFPPKDLDRSKILKIQKYRFRWGGRSFVLKLYTYEIDQFRTAPVPYTETVYTTLLKETFDGAERGDISKKGAMSSDDADVIRDFAANPNSIDPDYKRRIIDGLKRPILNNYTLYPDWLPNGSTGTIATATANLSSSTFSTGSLISVKNVSDWRNFQASDQKSIQVESVNNQYDAIHHYENSSKEHVDIDPNDSEIDTALYVPITYRQRLETQNDNLKIIKILKADVADQINTEFQKLLRG